jgi:carboxylesterase type B
VNIRNFGGDPSQVTLIGFSAGASSAHYQMISENSRGLFNRSISMGGNVLQNVANYIPRLLWAQKLASRLGFNSTSENEILEFLENANPVDIVREQLALVPLEAGLQLGFNIAFGPTREPYVTDGVFLHDDLSRHLESAWGNEIDYVSPTSLIFRR